MASRVLKRDGNKVTETVNARGWYQSQTFEEKKAIVAGAGCLEMLYVVNKSASTRYVYVFDSASASGTILAGPFVLGTEDFLSIDESSGIPFDTGVYVASSSTLATYTASAAADLSISAKWGLVS